ncbi:MAG: hypothetical protein GC160_28820 [Acidobacteria bacterium]|nr:hypothetical protein [Acidobacteriota bacterium]
MNAGLRCLLLSVLAWPVSLGAVEIATGSMLGPRYDEKSFYQRTSPRGEWTHTYQIGHFRKQVRGKLLGVRATYALFDDEFLEDESFTPDANTDRAIAALERYHRYGVTVVAVNLQGDAKPYDGPEARSGQARDGKKHGALIGAFQPDGTLIPAWTERLARLLEAANKLGIVVALTYFTPDQDEVFESPEAIVAAARNMTRWLIEQDARNVIIDIADRWDLEAELWDFGRFIPRNIGSLVIDVRDQFNSAAFTLPIGATGGNALAYPSSLAKLCDVILLRGGQSEASYRAHALGQHEEVERPVLLFGAEPLDAAAADRAAGAIFSAPQDAGVYPFSYGSEPDEPKFQPILHSIAKLALKKPPE